MAEKYNTILQLAAETEKSVAADGAAWHRFMDFAGRFIKYPFQEQILIYAQRPGSRACASMKVWDSMGCWINRGSSGIALIDTAAPRPKLKYVFDMADVTPEKAKNGRLPDLWNVKPEHEQPVMELLEAVYGKTDAQYPFGDRIAELMMEAAKGRYEKAAERLAAHVEGSLLDGMEKRKLQLTVFEMLMESAVCAVISACGTGHHPAGYGFRNIHKFNTPETLHIIGDEINALVRPVVAEIGRTVRAYEKQKETEKSGQGRGDEKNTPAMQKSLASAPERDYNALKRESAAQETGKKETDTERGAGYGTEIQTGRGLPDTGHRNGRTAGRGAEEVRPAEEKIPDGEQRSGVHDTPVRKQTDEPPVHTAGAGGGADGPDHRADGGGNGSGRSAQGTGPDVMGTENEQHPPDSGGDRPGGNDLHLSTDSQTKIKEKEPDNGQPPLSGSFQQDGTGNMYEQLDIFSMLSGQAGGVPFHSQDKGSIRVPAYKVPQEQLDMILRTGGGRNDSRKRIYAKYQQGKTPEEMAVFLKQEYGTVGKGFTFDGKQAAVWFDADGMRIGRGMSARENTILSMGWDEIEQNIRLQVENGAYMGAAENVDIRSEDFITQDEIDELLSRGSGVENGKFRIFNYFRNGHDSGDAIEFLKNEYGTGGRSGALAGGGESWEDHDSRGIKLRKGSIIKPYAEAMLSWNRVEKDIRRLINGDRYFSMADKEAYAAYQKEQGRKKLEMQPGRETLPEQAAPAGHEMPEEPDTRPGQKSDAGQELVPGREPAGDVMKAVIRLDTGSAVSETGMEPYNNDKDGENGVGQTGFYLKKAENFRIADDALGTGGGKEKFQRNVEAIRVLEKIESENRPATPEEQDILSQYAGWGGIPDAFDERKDAWAWEYRELKSLLSPEEYASARESTLNAHYTSPVVIRSIYSTLERMGFETGSILEPSMGTGNFFGMLPENMRGSRLYGVELDGITGRIAKQLYPGADIKISVFEKTSFPNDFFDIAVGNVPFGQYRVPDRHYDKLGFPVHEYFFAKALDQVRPGGVVAFVTSRWVMDKKTTETRKYLAQRAELLGAVRLPNNAFKDNAGTKVTADILFLQKLDRMAVKEPEWVQLSENADGISMNRYFVEHPEMVIGRMEMVSGPYGMESTCRPDTSRPFEEQLAEAVSHISGSISMTEYTSMEEAAAGIPADPDVKNYSYTVVDGSVYYRENSIMTPADVPETTGKRIKGMVQIRDCTQELIRLQMEECPDSAIKEKQEELNALYDNFTKSFGLLSSTGNKRAFSQDSSYFLLCSLEKLDDEGNFKGKADMFTKRTIKRAEPVTSVDTAAEALAVSLSEKAKVDLEYMAALAGKDTSAVINELSGIIFQNPVTGIWENADEYLSGDVRAKLAAAETFAENHPEYAVNVQALRQVQPRELEASEIDVRIGATWIDAEYIDNFMRDVLKTPEFMLEQGRIRTQYSKASGRWRSEERRVGKECRL